MPSIDQKLTEATLHYTELFGERECFRVWVENINCGEKYVVKCSFRSTFLNKRTTFKYSKTIRPDN
jgi:hypothetical protein